MVIESVSTWLQANGWANVQASPIQQIMTEQVAAGAALAGAQADYVLGRAGLAASAAAKRLQAGMKPEPVSLQTLIAAAGNIIDKLA